MKTLKKILNKTPFLNFLTKNAEITEKKSSKLEPILIKGNINKKGEKIAHVPGGRFYDIVKPVVTFQSIEEAEMQGYRLSRQ